MKKRRGYKNMCMEVPPYVFPQAAHRMEQCGCLDYEFTARAIQFYLTRTTAEEETEFFRLSSREQELTITRAFDKARKD